MLIEKKSSLLIRCSSCGRLEINQVNIFQLSGDRKLKYRCQCGVEKISISRESGSIILLPYCLVCDCRHRLEIPEQSFWGREGARDLSCPRSGLQLGCCGSYVKLKHRVDRQQQELELLADGLGFDDFENPEAMLTVLDVLHDFAAAGRIICECGNFDINVELDSERVTLTCGFCGALLSVPAAGEADISWLRNQENLELSSCSTTTPPGTFN